LDLLVLNGRDTTALRSLAEFYYGNRRYTSSALVALDFLEKFPGNMVATEIIALSYEQLRLYDKAIEFYQPIWLKTENINILYQISYLQYSLKRYTESLNNLQIVDGKVKTEDKVQLNTSNGQVQEIAFKAAILNLRALIAIEQGNSAEAKTLLTQALQLSPDFEAAKITLDDLNKG
jgi:tetratricopeptide (TPR) repeat protein